MRQTKRSTHSWNRCQDIVTKAGGTVDKVDKWGKRRLAYRVEKYREGIYVLFQFTASADDREGVRAPSARAGCW